MLINCPRCLEPVEAELPAPCPECMVEIKVRLAAWPSREKRNEVWGRSASEETPSGGT